MLFPLEAMQSRVPDVGPKIKAWVEMVHARPAYQRVRLLLPETLVPVLILAPFLTGPRENPVRLRLTFNYQVLFSNGVLCHPCTH